MELLSSMHITLSKGAFFAWCPFNLEAVVVNNP